MPVYAQAEDLNNGLIPSGNVLPEQTGFDVALPEGLILSHCHRSLPYGGLQCDRTIFWLVFSDQPDSLNWSKVITHMLIK